MAGAFEDRVVVITGAGRGVGREYALFLAGEGAEVVVNDLGGARDGSGADDGPAAEVVKEIEAAAGTAIANGDDVADSAGAQRLIDAAVDAFGTIHGLINNAGILRDRTLVNMADDDWDVSLQVNLRGAFAPTRAAARFWRERSKAGEPVDAAVVFTSSESGVFANAGQANYAAAKAGVAALSEVCHKELRRYGVRCNAILPRARTRLTEDIVGRPKDGRFDHWDPANLPPFVAYLLSDVCAISGQVFLVGGGKVQRAAPWSLDHDWLLKKDGRWTLDEITGAVAEAGPPTNEGRDTGGHPLTADAPLAGMRVLDLSRAISGPYAGRILADLGADVVKIEPVDGDVSNIFGRMQAGRSGLFAQMNVGKRSIALDLRKPEDAELARRLAAAADVLVENFRTGVLGRLGLSYEGLSDVNPGLVVLSISGFGAMSPESRRRAFAPVIHAESGALVRQARIHSQPLADHTTSAADTLSALHGVIGVLAALRRRDATGRGSHVDLGMLEAVVASDDQAHWSVEASDGMSENWGQIYDAVGGPVMVAMNAKGVWRSLSRSARLEDGLSADASPDEKGAWREAVITSWLSAFPTREEMTGALEGAGLGWADVRAPEELLEEPTMEAMPPYEEVDDGGGGTRRIVRMPYRIGDWRSAVRGRVAPIDSDRLDVLADWLG